jgi:U3 small nucleolar ribonucleoprotein component
MRPIEEKNQIAREEEEVEEEEKERRRERLRRTHKEEFTSTQ